MVSIGGEGVIRNVFYVWENTRILTHYVMGMMYGTLYAHQRKADVEFACNGYIYVRPKMFIR